ncbi:ComF family protein [Helicobacter cholecystus]|uniref:ComF family protein n=1 Tax=Helicobacter cholecystus TaxID=45498 RepID=UPI0027393CAD|nr:ComF family protein [Helicobacter cholecystus]
MKCLVCGAWSLRIICKKCQECIVFKPTIRLLGDFKVYSFFAYSEIETLLYYKYTPIGSRVYQILCNLAQEYFRENFSLQAWGVGIDDCIKRGYSHNGIFLHTFKKCGIRPIYGELLAKNKVSYAGKTLKYRQDHPKGFDTSLEGCKDLIIFDDILTTGTSLLEAKKVLEEKSNEILFALTLCNARE